MKQTYKTCYPIRTDLISNSEMRDDFDEPCATRPYWPTDLGCIDAPARMPAGSCKWVTREDNEYASQTNLARDRAYF